MPSPSPISLCHCLCHNSHICHPLRTTHPSLFSSHSHLLASQERGGSGEGVKREVEPFKRAYTYRFLFHFYPCSTLSYTACLPFQCLSPAGLLLPLTACLPLPASCLLWQLSCLPCLRSSAFLPPPALLLLLCCCSSCCPAPLPPPALPCSLRIVFAQTFLYVAYCL